MPVAVAAPWRRRLKARWEAAGLGAPMVVLESPYRTLLGPLLAYADALQRGNGAGAPLVTVVLPELIPAH